MCFARIFVAYEITMELKYVIRKKNPDICLLNETHVTNECDINDLSIQNYQSIHCLSHSKHTGGVSVLVKKNIKYTNVSACQQQIAWYLSIELNIYKTPTVIAGVYLSSKNEHKNSVISSFVEWLESIPSGKNIIICGDFNIDMLSNNVFSRRLQNICDDNGLTQLTKKATRIAINSATMIDLCLTNVHKSKISCNVVDDEQISDHSMLDIYIKGKYESQTTKKRVVNVWRNYDYEKLCQNLLSKLISWESVQLKQVNDKTDWLLNVISESTAEFKHTKEIKVTDDFFDSELEQMRREKNRLYKVAEISPNVFREQNWLKYREYKNEYKKVIATKKYESNQKKLDKANGDMKQTWKVVNSILNKEHSEILYIKENENVYESDNVIVEKFNEYFVDSIVQLNQNIPQIEYEHSTLPAAPSVFKFHGISIAEIKHCLRQMKNNTDEYFVNARVLLDSMDVIGNQLADIINDCFSSGVFPNALKKSTVTPIQKKSGTVLINEHRPINMLPVVERVLEKLTYSQLIEYVNKNNLIADHQSGFRANHSCESAINDVLFEWKQAMNESKLIIAVFLDFQRAFETIEPKILLEKLVRFGIKETELKYFESYLSNRRQVVKLGEFISREINNQLGVPQGSVLGPLLFILYINDLGDCLKNCKIKMFADDTLIYIIADCLETASMLINDDLSRLFNKLCQNKLKLNVDKTKVMIISNKKIDRNNVNIFINGSRLEIENEIKYLGIIIDDKLRFDKNNDYLCKKIGKKVNVLSRLRHELSTGQITMLYKTLIQPHFTYCSSILFLSTKNDLDRLQSLQNKCMKNILRVSKYTSTNLLNETLQILSVRQMIIYRTMIFIFKIINGNAPIYLTNKIKYRNEIHNRHIRNSNYLEPVNATKACSQNSLFFKGIRMFNELPREIREEPNPASFERKLKSYVKHQF